MKILNALSKHLHHVKQFTVRSPLFLSWDPVANVARPKEYPNGIQRCKQIFQSFANTANTCFRSANNASLPCKAFQL